MKKRLLLISLLITLNANATSLNCQIDINGEKAYQGEVISSIGNVINFKTIDEFRFKLHEKENSQFTIEVYDGTLPSRSYAEGRLLTFNDSIKWSLWTREAIIDVACKLSK